MSQDQKAEVWSIKLGAENVFELALEKKQVAPEGIVNLIGICTEMLIKDEYTFNHNPRFSYGKPGTERKELAAGESTT